MEITDEDGSVWSVRRQWLPWRLVMVDGSGGARPEVTIRWGA